MAIQFRCYLKRVLILTLLFNILIANDFFNEAYIRATGSSRASLESSRKNDLNFIFPEPLCCCNSKVLNLFRIETQKFESRINPAIDILIDSLKLQMEETDLVYKELKNYKLINAMYAFKDDVSVIFTPSVLSTTSNVIQGNNSTNSQNSNRQGLIVPLDFNNEADRRYYLESIVNRFESSGNYGAYNSSSGAYGRYQFIPSTGAQYCRLVQEDCCSYWHTNTEKGRDCQDKMFIRFTQDNIEMFNRYNIESNSATIYIAHQQGIGGLLWLRGGKNPYSTFETLKRAIVQNTAGKYHTMALNATTEDELREAYISYWNIRFGGDIMADIGNSLPVEEFTEQVYEFNEYVSSIRSLYREGILKEQMNVNYLFKAIKELP